MDKYRAYKYDMLVNNCNHFSDELIRILFNNRKSIPYYVNRAAWIGSWFHCIVPTKYVTVCPEGREDEGAELMAKWKSEDEMSSARLSTKNSDSVELTSNSGNNSFID